MRSLGFRLTCLIVVGLFLPLQVHPNQWESFHPSLLRSPEIIYGVFPPAKSEEVGRFPTTIRLSRSNALGARLSPDRKFTQT